MSRNEIVKPALSQFRHQDDELAGRELPFDRSLFTDDQMETKRPMTDLPARRKQPPHTQLEKWPVLVQSEPGWCSCPDLTFATPDHVNSCIRRPAADNEHMLDRVRRGMPYCYIRETMSTKCRKSKTFMKLFVAALMASVAICPPIAAAAEFPSQPIRIIVPFPPGASTDVVTRLLAEDLRQSLGQTVTVENRPGGTGQIGVGVLARSTPNGYTIGLGNEATHVTVPLLKKRPSFDPVKDFTPLTIAIRTTMAIAVNPVVLRARTLRELIEAASKTPGGISFATPGAGSPQHLIGELLKQRSGANFVHIPYSGSAPATNDLLAGNIPMIISTLPALMAHRDKITIIAIGDAERLPYLPDVPTISETMPDFVVGGWSGYFGPANLPGPIAARLNAALVSALHKPLVIEAIRKQALEPAGTSAQELLTLVKSGLERWAPVIERAQIGKED